MPTTHRQWPHSPSPPLPTFLSPHLLPLAAPTPRLFDPSPVCSVFGSACYIEDSFPSMMFMAYKYAGKSHLAAHSEALVLVQRTGCVCCATCPLRLLTCPACLTLCPA